MPNSGRTTTRRTKRSAPSPAALSAKVARLWQDAIVDRPPKHWTISNNGVIGANVWPYSGTALNQSAPQLWYILTMARGTTVQSRLADYAYISRVSIKGQINFGTAVAGDCIVKYMLVQQKVVQGTGILVANFGLDYFGDNTPSSNSIPNINNKDLLGKYTVLKTGTVNMFQSVTGILEMRNFSIEWAAKKHRKISYVLGNAGTVADIDTGGIFLYFYTGYAGLGTGATGINVYLEGNCYFRDQV